MVKPWYYSYKEYLITATSFLESLNLRMLSESLKQKSNSNEEKILTNFFQDLDREYLTKFIFESNNIEKEGLPEGETKKLVLDLIEENKLTEVLEYFQNLLVNVQYEIIPKRKVNAEKLNLNDLNFVMKYSCKKKDLTLVSNSFIALITARDYLADYINEYVDVFKKLDISELMELTDVTELNLKMSRIIRDFKNRKEDGNYLITESRIKELHKLLSDQMDNNENGAPGEYRPQSAYINLKTTFQQPSLIDRSMKNLIKNYQDRFKKDSYNPFIEACKFTGDFNNIHPFGDFNGRIARILLNMILQLERIPFYIILRSNAVDKKKYMTAMKHYYQGRPNTYLALVCKVFTDEIESINSRLKMAGIQQIEPIKLNDVQLKLIDDALAEYEKNTIKF